MAWPTPAATRGLGNLPCYSYYSQTMGPTNWIEHQRLGRFRHRPVAADKLAVLSAGLRWEREQMPPPIAALGQPRASFHGKCPLWESTGGRASVWPGKRREPLAGAAARLRHVLWPDGKRDAGDRADPDRLSQWRFEFLHPAHRRLNPTSTSGAPPFPYVLAGEPLKCGQAGGRRVCARIPQSRSASGRGRHGGDTAWPRAGHRQRDGSAWAGGCPSPSTPISIPRPTLEPSPTP